MAPLRRNNRLANIEPEIVQPLFAEDREENDGSPDAAIPPPTGSVLAPDHTVQSRNHREGIIRLRALIDDFEGIEDQLAFQPPESSVTFGQVF